MNSLAYRIAALVSTRRPGGPLISSCAVERRQVVLARMSNQVRLSYGLVRVSVFKGLGVPSNPTRLELTRRYVGRHGSAQ
jgi:hypothetical protein